MGLHFGTTYLRISMNEDRDIHVVAIQLPPIFLHLNDPFLISPLSPVVHKNWIQSCYPDSRLTVHFVVSEHILICVSPSNRTPNIPKGIWSNILQLVMRFQVELRHVTRDNLNRGNRTYIDLTLLPLQAPQINSPSRSYSYKTFTKLRQQRQATLPDIASLRHPVYRTARTTNPTFAIQLSFGLQSKRRTRACWTRRRYDPSVPEKAWSPFEDRQVSSLPFSRWVPPETWSCC